MSITATIVNGSTQGTAAKIISAIEKSWPGEIGEDERLVLRWGQNTKLNPKKDTVIFDMGYFGRDSKDPLKRHFRLSINEYHPTNLPPAQGDRWDKLGLEMKDYFDDAGHILLIGTGRKARIKNTGSAAPIWSTAALKRLKEKYPNKKIIYRPKKNTPGESFEGIVTDYNTSIEDLCKGCSLIYTEHSNVGNEGILYGIPVVTEGGPASDVCPSILPDNPIPLEKDIRLDYLHRIAYWNWSLGEIKKGKLWPWLLNEIERRRKQ